MSAAKKLKAIVTAAACAAAITAAPTASAQLSTAANGPYYATPSWDQKLTTNRFVILANWSNAAVLDRETGLVWERSPSTTPDNWFDAVNRCIGLNLGERKGWRLPTIHELSSLVDGSAANVSSPRLPPGHPFIGVQSTWYWSSTRYFGSGDARNLSFGSGNVDSDGSATSNDYYIWCVRGAQGRDAD